MASWGSSAIGEAGAVGVAGPVDRLAVEVFGRHSEILQQRGELPELAFGVPDLGADELVKSWLDRSAALAVPMTRRGR